MKKQFLLLWLMLFVCLMNCFGQTTRSTTANLNMRKGPSTNYSVVLTIPANTQVTILEQDYHAQWLRVKYNGYTGYVHTKYLTSSYKLSSSRDSYSTTYSTGGNGYYINCDGQQIQSPTYYNVRPQGATAICRDGTYSFSTHRRGTCSRHGGVKEWLD